jgi:membrane-bound serine protease (ClpP class)
MIEEARAVHAEEALQAGLIDTLATDVDDLLRRLDGLEVAVAGRPLQLSTAGASQVEMGMSAVEVALQALANPVLAGILLTIGIQALLIEMSSPGGWAAGLIGVLCLGLAFYGAGLLPVNWLGLGLLAVAFVLFLLEVKAATHGALAAAGAATMLAGLLVLFNAPGRPEFARLSVAGAAAITLPTAAFFLFLVGKALSARHRPVLTGAEGLLGQLGTVRAPLTEDADTPGTFVGTVLVMGELWRAVSDEPAGKGSRVAVKAVEGMTLRVKKVGTP